MKLDSFSEILDDVRQGRPIVVVDHTDRENEGDIVVAAEKITAETINFMLQHGKGLVCVSLPGEKLVTLGIPDQVSDNSAPLGTRFTVSIDHHSVGGEGVTAWGRARTIQALIQPDAEKKDFVVPGFVFPLRAVEGGVLRRNGHTEAAVDLARLATLTPAGVICEIMGENGQMLREEALVEYCQHHHLRCTSVQAIADYRLQHDITLRRCASCELTDVPSFFSPDQKLKKLRVIVYVDDTDEKEHLAFVYGEPQDGCLVRIHSECLTGDVFESLRCDCGSQFAHALRGIVEDGAGVLVYLHQEGRGIGLGNKLRAYQLQDQGLNTVQANLQLGFEPDYREYRAGAHILSELGLKSVRLMTNNPQKIESLNRHGIRVVERAILPLECHEGNREYLRAKRDLLGHLVEGLGE